MCWLSYVTDIVVLLKDEPPFKGKKLLNVEDVDVQFLYISLQFIFPETSYI
jgi:hypothetical protein